MLWADFKNVMLSWKGWMVLLMYFFYFLLSSYMMSLNKEAELDWVLIQRQRPAVTTYHNRKESGLLVREPLNETCLP